MRRQRLWRRRPLLTYWAPRSHWLFTAARTRALAPDSASFSGPCPCGLSEWPPFLAVVLIPGSSTLPCAVEVKRRSPTLSCVPGSV